jgi:hypothetical protein
VGILYTALRINILRGSILWKPGEYFSDAQKVSIAKVLLAVRLQHPKYFVPAIRWKLFFGSLICNTQLVSLAGTTTLCKEGM